ncbi:hypothetical protein FNV43_RR25816 [Rhamnella rubrinervis]|uniref:Uncharacterized protein n=1 Tax=Rhamnella rubrinervis TaxID=2594499 RepID=A0A8K0DLS3_9ROSA|nr:hypothetical protein FNV43_RR25816 [Rhamnella rubrinervis]
MVMTYDPAACDHGGVVPNQQLQKIGRVRQVDVYGDNGFETFTAPLASWITTEIPPWTHTEGFSRRSIIYHSLRPPKASLPPETEPLPIADGFRILCQMDLSVEDAIQNHFDSIENLKRMIFNIDPGLLQQVQPQLLKLEEYEGIISASTTIKAVDLKAEKDKNQAMAFDLHLKEATINGLTYEKRVLNERVVELEGEIQQLSVEVGETE